MKNKKDFNWFKDEIVPKLNLYSIDYRFFEEGDFGSLNQILIESSQLGGQVDFWSSDWLGIHIIDKTNYDDLLNVLLEPEEWDEKNLSLEKLSKILMK